MEQRGDDIRFRPSRWRECVVGIGVAGRGGVILPPRAAEHLTEMTKDASCGIQF
jgi:hypothetical protein